MICAQRDLCRIEWMHCATDVRAATRAISGFLCRSFRRQNPGVARYLPERWQHLVDGPSRGTDMTLLLSGLRIALVVYVVAAVALYVLQDRLLLPPVPIVTDIRMGHHANYDVQPWYPRDEHAGYVIAPAGREPIAT